MAERQPSATSRPTAPGQRRITADQFAFLRAVILGMPLEDAAQRYLHPGMDLRLVKRELRWLRTELLAAARRAHAWGDARVLALDMAQLPTGKPVVKTPSPSLEEFRGQVDPEGDFYREAELLELYRERYPPAATDRRSSRVARLRERQRQSLTTLEQVLVQPPAREDPPSAWFEPKVARRVEAVGLKTLGQLADWIAQRGHRWHSVVPKLGTVGARRIVDWIERNAEVLGVQIDPTLQMTRRELIEASRRHSPEVVRPAPLPAPPAVGSVVDSGAAGQPSVLERRPMLSQIVPLERLVIPAALDGSHGSNRMQSAQALRAANDVEAIEAWIAAVAAGNVETERAYRREAERLVLWAVFERGVPMSSLTTEDATAYRAFLADPQPSDRWVSQRGGIRLSPAWRPFRGPLSARSVAYAITVVTTLFDWLVQEHYLVRNIWRGLSRRRTLSAAAEAHPDRLMPETGRWLTTAQWGVMCSVLRALGAHEEDERTRLVCLLDYTTGLRRSELAGACLGHLDAMVSEPETTGDEGEGVATGGTPSFVRRVVLRVLGKGNKVRVVPIVPQIEAQLNTYLAARGLPAWTDCMDLAAEDPQRFGWLRSVPLIAQIREARRWSNSRGGEGADGRGHGDRLAGEGASGHKPALCDRQGNPIDLRQAPLSTKRVYEIVKEAFQRGERMLRKRGHARDAEVFARASTHWLRHTFGRHAAGDGVKLHDIQALLGHSSLQTTTIYTSDGGSGAWDAVLAFTSKRV